MRSAIKTGVVPEFKGEHFFLSNFYEAEFTWRNFVFPTAEHAFQWAKVYCLKDEISTVKVMKDWSDKFLSAQTPAQAKYHGRSVPINLEAWEAIKVQYMREIIHAKFSTAGDNIVGQLLNTGVMLLVEGNDWGDKFWGRCKNKDGKTVGLNTLGTILMEERGYWLYSNFEDKK